MAETVLSLPSSLLLLVHLHILEYPHANKPEYDHHVFDPKTRGLRDRTKTMEDTCYFLVGRVERKDAKAVLPTYPCLQPSDTTAFRTSLSKYLESLRNQAIYPSSGVHNKGLRDKGKVKPGTTESSVAWWWKDVVVRKSLLEECAGERFERLLVALSTHALLKNTSGRLDNVSKENSGNLIHIQPGVYTSSLKASQSTRHSWDRSASLLIQRQIDLARIRDRLAKDDEECSSSIYETLTTERLLAFSDSKLQDLMRHWKGLEGRHALEKMTELAGLQPTARSQAIPVDPETSSNLNGEGIRDSGTPPTSTPPLPIAAAHHPSNLRKLRAPLFPSTKSKSKSKSRRSSLHPASTQSQSHATIALSEPLRKEEDVQQSLKAALARAKIVGEQLSSKVHQMKDRNTGGIIPSVDFELWDEEEGVDVDFSTTPTTELLSSFSLYTPPGEGELESRIDFIRESRLPSFPPIPAPEPTPPSPPPRSTPPQLPIQPPTPPPQTPRQLQTSTPPASIKPWSAYARRVLAEQGGGTTTTSRVVTFKTPTGKDNINRRMSKGGVSGRSGRKSIRFSLAHMKRPSLFGPEVDVPLDEDDDDGEDEVNRILDAVEDGDSSGTFEDPITPKPKTPINRIITSGSPLKRSNVKNTLPRISFAIPERKSLAPLPEGESGELLCDEEWIGEDGESDEEDETEEDGDGDEFEYEGNSMTLRDILLKAGDDVTQFDLMEDDGQPLEGQSFGWD